VGGGPPTLQFFDARFSFIGRAHRARAVSRSVSGVSGLSVMWKTGRGGAIPAGTAIS
jgi:hypothetical protein